MSEDGKDEENEEDMISNVNVTTNKRHRQESSHLRQRDTNKKKHKEEERTPQRYCREVLYQIEFRVCSIRNVLGEQDNNNHTVNYSQCCTYEYVGITYWSP